VGKILYGDSGVEIIFDDRAMAHLQLVIGAKLRRGESFFFSWKDDPSVGDGRSSVWLDSSIPLYFKYLGSRPVAINREWIDALTLSANMAGGLQFSAEPASEPTNNPKSNVAPRPDAPPIRGSK
jgi:hypothetical protein